MNFDQPFKNEGSGYEGEGFKYNQEEFKKEVDELIALGASPEKAKEAVIVKEKEIRENQHTKPDSYDLGEITDHNRAA